MSIGFWITLSMVVSFALTALSGFVLIPWLRKLKFGQTIYDIGPAWHKSKQGTPTMGGIMFILGTIIAFAVTVLSNHLAGGNLILDYSGSQMPNAVYIKLFGGLIMAFFFGLIGFVDDYIKVVKKRNLGLTIAQKTVAQLLVIVGYLVTLRMAGTPYIFIPFVGNREYEILFWILGVCVVYGAVNAVNFTDGIDGLCSSVTLTAAIAFTVIAFLQKYMGVSVLAASLVGACAGYLIWNWNPAKVFMGDTGSMFLGGMVVAMAYAVDCPLILIPVGIIYIIEGLSDVLQISYFKATHGKRIFKMAPIHHHFEMSGWKEKKIVFVFSAVNAVGCIIGILLMYFGRV